MKFTKDQLKNVAFVLLLGLILFTPLGFYPRVIVTRILSFSPSAIDESKQQLLSNYQWKLSNMDGKVTDFEDVKGKVILVNFWATWCPPCVAEMPSLQDLYDDYNDKVEFVFVAHDEKEKVLQFLNRKAYTFPVYFEQSTAPDFLSATSIPTTYIIDSNGKIIVKKTGAANWNSETIRRLLDVLVLEE